jgi:hypothetical protein
MNKLVFNYATSMKKKKPSKRIPCQFDGESFTCRDSIVVGILNRSWVHKKKRLQPDQS